MGVDMGCCWCGREQFGGVEPVVLTVGGESGRSSSACRAVTGIEREASSTPVMEHDDGTAAAGSERGMRAGWRSFFRASCLVLLVKAEKDWSRLASTADSSATQYDIDCEAVTWWKDDIPRSSLSGAGRDCRPKASVGRIVSTLY